MKGLDISERYFREYGAPMIEQRFGDYRERIAAGLVGEGSECYGFDDEISRDHDWGPGFCLWLNKEDYLTIGAYLKGELDEIPAEFEGFGPREVTEWGGGRIGVFEIGEFYKRYTGFDHVPANIREWRSIPEVNLATCTNGKVFTDPLGEFTRFREGLKGFYPEEVRLKKIASRCMSIAQLGQYNFMRCIQRKEFVAARYVEAQFSAHVISLVFLLNRRYTPFYKWMHRAMKELPVLGELVHKLLSDIAIGYGPGKKNQLMGEICALVIDEFRIEGLSDSPSGFLLDHAPVIQSKIRDDELRNADIRME
ncbi:DUF4037 domain-containing protein [Chloroflexota bacterium]